MIITRTMVRTVVFIASRSISPWSWSTFETSFDSRPGERMHSRKMRLASAHRLPSVRCRRRVATVVSSDSRLLLACPFPRPGGIERADYNRGFMLLPHHCHPLCLTAPEVYGYRLSRWPLLFNRDIRTPCFFLPSSYTFHADSVIVLKERKKERKKKKKRKDQNQQKRSLTFYIYPVLYPTGYVICYYLCRIFSCFQIGWNNLTPDCGRNRWSRKYLRLYVAQFLDVFNFIEWNEMKYFKFLAT